MTSELIKTVQKDVPVSMADIALIERQFGKKHYRRGDMLLQAGEVPHEVFFVLEGTLHQFYTQETGTGHTCNFTSLPTTFSSAG